jgi:flagellar export protein FliJ
VDALAALLRLARQERDAARHALAAVDQASAAVRDQLAGLHAAAERERAAPCELADGNSRLVAYLRRLAGRARELQAELDRLERRREAVAARLAERHLELRRLQILVERRAERARVERRGREQKALDELVATRRRRPARYKS